MELDEQDDRDDVDRLLEGEVDDPGGEIQISLDDDGDEPGDDEQPKTRREKKRERGELWSALEEQRRENQTLREQVGELRGLAQSIHPAALQSYLLGNNGQAKPVDETQSELDQIYEQQQNLSQLYYANSDKLTQQDRERIAGQARKLEERRVELLVKKQGAGQAPPVDPRQVASQTAALVVRTQNEGRYPDVYGDETLLRAANQRYHELKAKYTEVGRDGRTRLTRSPQQIHDQAMDETRARSGNGARSDSDRHLFTAGRRGGGKSAKSTKTVKMGPTEKTLARALYPDLPEKEAYVKWAKGPGRRAAESAG